MSPPKVFSGQLPLMQVSEQPSGNYDTGRDLASFRLQLHTFVDNRTSLLPSTTPFQTGPIIRHNDQTSNPPPAYKRIAFTAANVPGRDPSKRNADVSKSPKRKKRRTTQGSGQTKLRSLKPLSASSSMHSDAWSIVLAHTRPGFLLQMRTVSKFFYHITNTETIWRNAREHHFGAGMPPRPSFLTERQYACLLDGRGCQNPSCERRETRKVRWVFRLRLCDECLSRKLDSYKNDGTPSPQSRYATLFPYAAERDRFGTNLVDLLPTSGTWGGRPSGPRSVNRETGKWSSHLLSPSSLMYLKSDFVALQEEYKKIQDEDWEPQRVLDWVEEKYNKATVIAKNATEIESWEFHKFSDNLGFSVRGQRADFFVSKARQLSPPMSEDVLSCFAAYQTSLASSNVPTERSWDTLRAKIVPYRPLAEHVAKCWNSRYVRFMRPHTSTSEDDRIFNRLHDRRKLKRRETGDWSSEQQFVLDLAEEEFNGLNGHVADEDLLLLCLRNVHSAYERCPTKPQGLRHDGVSGEYRLSLDDAKLIVEEIFEKRIKKSTLRGVKVLESLRCMGCTRFTSGKRYSFQSAFEHMLEKHSKLVGKDLHFHQFLKNITLPSDCLSKDFRFPWYMVEWSRSLPLLPTHAEITAETKWIPDEDVPYVQLEKTGTRSAFEGRHAVPHGEHDFLTNFVHAAKTMSTTRLDQECIVKIAVQYGKALAGAQQQPSIDDFFTCVQPTQALGVGLHFKFRCGACNSRPDVNSHLRCVKHSVEASVLRKHWDDKHAHEKLEWSTDFMDLPTDENLLEIMRTQDEKLRQDQANSVQRETVGLKKSLKKIADQKASALMQKKMAMDAFAQLFVLDESTD